MVASGKCECGDDSSSSFQKKEEGKCQEKSSSEKETKKKPCFPLKYKEDKGKCHSSHEQFKQKSSDKCQSSEDTMSQKDKCHSSREAFLKGGQGKRDPCCEQSDKSDKQCHESRKQFLKAKTESSCGQSKKSDKQCHDSLPFLKEKAETPCGRTEKSAKQCQDSLPLKEKTEKTCGQLKKSDKQCHDPLPFLKEKRGGDKCPGPYNTISASKASCCSSPLKYAQAKDEKQPCSSSFEKMKDDSTLSKLSSYCKKLAKQCMKPKSKSKCSSLESTCEKSSLPEKSVPSQPTVETGLGCKPAVQPCSSPGTCPEVKKPFLTDFFPLDARNKQLNECIAKYMKIDPSQVISKCSRFANNTSDLTEKCLETIKKSQMKCVGVVKSSDAAVKMQSLVSARGRFLVSRWGPSTAAYLTTAALLTVYVTEWKTVLKYLPLYSHLGHQEENDNK